VHVSNFRPVKRVDAVVTIFDRIRKQTPARLLLVGDGPDLAMAQQMARDLGIGALVDAVGAQEEVVPLLSIADLFLLPSAQESFGLAALEAMACEVPVIASRVGGLPEVIEHGVSGFLHPLDAIVEMATSGVTLLKDPSLHRSIAQAACRRVRSEFCVEKVVPMYEACYREILS
jgi:N-acetyl-alpha-D-glucosaminyl L-malate synthase BshA